jgi:hypothetical protein
MRLKKNTTVYDELWKNGSTPDIEKMKGIFHVEVCSGLMMNLPRWRKEFDETIIQFARRGKNMFGRRDTVFGFFRSFIQPTYTRSDVMEVLMLEYDSLKIIDYIVEICPGLYLGQFYWRKKFQAYFWLYQITDDIEEKVQALTDV